MIPFRILCRPIIVPSVSAPSGPPPCSDRCRFRTHPFLVTCIAIFLLFSLAVPVSAVLPVFSGIDTTTLSAMDPAGASPVSLLAGTLSFTSAPESREKYLNGISPDGMGSLEKSVQTSLAAFRYDDRSGAWTAKNYNQNMAFGTTDTGGIIITGNRGSAGMQLAGIGRDPGITNIPAGKIHAEGTRLEIARGAGTEWYINGNAGIEQGMTITSRPEGTGNLRAAFDLSGTLTPAMNGQTLVFSDRNGSVIRYSGLRAYDATGRTLPAAMILDGTRLTWQVDDRDAVYPVTIDPTWTQVTTLSASVPSSSAYFGWSAAISNDTVVVGEYYATVGTYAQAGKAYIFQKDQGGLNHWGQVAVLNATVPAANNYFGQSVGISNDTAIVGAMYAQSTQIQAGKAYVFRKDQGGLNHWGQVVALNASDPGLRAYFGYSVGISNDTAIVGARSATAGGYTTAGKAYIFRKDQGGLNHWGQVAALNATVPAAGNFFGWSVSLSNDTAVVGENYATVGTYTTAGKAYIFRKDQGGLNHWGQVAALTASDAAANAYFGQSASISNDTAVVGAYSTGSGGKAYIFRKDQGGLNQWGQVAILSASGSSYFGNSAGISNDIAVIGAYYTANVGKAYVFQKDQGGLNQWGQVAALNSTGSGHFGQSVGISNGTIVVGDNYATSGGYTNAGQAYIFAPVPIAGFSATPTSGSAPISVQFMDTSSNTPTGWQWNATNVVGNNTPFTFSTAQNPLSVFGAGNYSIKLNATNSFGSNVSGQVTFVNVSGSTLTITAISPGSGPLAAGTLVNITGTNLAGATSVTFGGIVATINANTATAINMTAPAGSAGAGPVTVLVTTPAGTATTSYTYRGAPIDGVIGFRWNTSDSSPRLYQIDSDGTVIPNATGDWFNTHLPWSGMRTVVVNASNSTPILYGTNTRGDGLDLSGTYGDVMVEIPWFYTCSTYANGNISYWISPVPQEALHYTVHPMFNQRGVGTDAGTPAPYIYVGRYDANLAGTKFQSATGKTAAVSLNAGTQRTYAENKGAGWGVTNIWTYSGIRQLFYTEMATLNSQTAWAGSRGIVDAGDKLNSGADGINTAIYAINATGNGTGTNGKTPVSYRGIENLWGNVAQFQDGITATKTDTSVINATGLGLTGQSTTFQIPMNANDVQSVGSLAGNTMGYQKNWVSKDSARPLFLPSEVGGSQNTYLSDYYMFNYYADLTPNILWSGGQWNFGGDAGIDELYLYGTSSYADNGVGARLEFRKSPAPVAGFGSTNISLATNTSSQGWAGTTPFVMQFTDMSTNSPASWSWARSNLTSPSWTVFNTSQNARDTFWTGNWSVNLTAVNSGGKNVSYQTLWVNVSPQVPAPVSGFTVNTTAGTAPLTVQFTDMSTNTPTAWIWNATNVMGNNTQFTFSTLQSPTSVFGAGNYSIKLNATNVNGFNVSSQTTFVNVSGSTLTITAISPGSGPLAAGTLVNITGTNLAGATSVTFGGTAASINANTATAINMTAPAGSAGAGPVTVLVTTPAGTTATSYTYRGAPIDGVIGFRWNTSDSSPRLYQIDSDGTVIPNATGDWFNTHLPWSGMKTVVVNASNSTPVLYGTNNRGDGLDLSGTYGDVMVEIPRFYTCSTYANGNLSYWISPVPQDALHYTVAPMFNQRGVGTDAGTPAPYYYVGRFDANLVGNTLQSATGKVPAVSITLGTARTYAENKGAGWGITNIWTLSALRQLFYTEMVTLNSQVAWTGSRGIVDTGAASASGADGINNAIFTINATGSGTGTNGYTPVSYRGIENLWGNVWQFQDGFNAFKTPGTTNVINATGLGLTGQNTIFKDLLDENDRQSVGGLVLVTDTSNGEYQTNLLNTDIARPLFLPSQTGGAGSETTYLSDKYWSPTSVTATPNILFSGGAWYDKGGAGDGSLVVDNYASFSHEALGARLEFRKSPAPVAGFGSTNISIAVNTSSPGWEGTTPFVLQFTDMSTNSPASWSWARSNLTSPSWTVFNTSQNARDTFWTGNWSVNLTAVNSGGKNVSYQTLWVNVSPQVPAPVSGFTVNTTAGTAPLTVQFTDMSTNTPTAWIWNATNVMGNNTQFTFSTAQSPSSVFGAGNFSIKLNATNANGFNVSSQVTFINVSASAPVLLGILPSSGLNTTATSVTITGSGFIMSPAPAVNLSRAGYATVPLTGVSAASATLLSGTIPAGIVAGPWNVTVVNPDGRNGTNASVTFTVTAPAPAPMLLSVSPVTGFNTTVTEIVITGTGFNTTTAPAVNLSRSGYSNITLPGSISSSTSFAAVVPEHLVAGVWNMTVINPDGREATNASVTFAVTAPSPAPTVTRITPSTGPNTTTTSVTVTGTGFNTTTVPAVRLNRAGFSNVTLTSVTVASPTSLAAIVPDKVISGVWNVYVVNPDLQEGALANGFTVSAPVPAPTVTGITPSTGLNTSSISITNLAGTNFQSGASVFFTPVTAHPVHKGSITNGTGGAMLDAARSVYVAGDYAYVASYASNALEIVDVTDPALPRHKGKIVNGQDGAALNNPISVFVSGNYAYVTTTGSQALEIVDISDPASPRHKGKITNGEGGAALLYPASVFVSGNYAYVSDSNYDALEIVNVTDPASPRHEGLLSGTTGGAALIGAADVKVAGNYAYVASGGSQALEIVDVTNKSGPVHKGKLMNGGSVLLNDPRGIFVAGNYAYVVSENGNSLEIVNVTNPADPKHAGSLANGAGGALLDSPMSIFVSGNNAYIASEKSQALEIVDVTNSADPKHAGSLVTGGSALLQDPRSVFVSGRYAYVASTLWDNALEIVDVGLIPGTGVNIVSPAQITCSVNLTGAIAGSYNIVVTNPDGQSAALTNGFAVTAPIPAPAVTGIIPSTGMNSTTTAVTVTGAGFNTTVGSDVRLTRTGFTNVTLSDVSKTSSTSITGTVPAGVVSGVWNVFVVNPDKQEGTNASVTFTATVPAPAPRLLSIEPSYGLNTSTTLVTITGTGFNTTIEPTVNLTRSGYANITLTEVLASPPTLTILTRVVPEGIIPGTWNVVIINPDHQEAVNASVMFNVTAPIPAPVVTGITPPTGVNTTTTAVTITGTGFNTTTGSDVRLTRAGFTNVTLTDVSKTSTTSITGTVPAGVVSGVWNVFVVNPDKQEGSLANGFTVTAPIPAPVVTGITPPTGVNSTTTSVTITGTGFNTTVGSDVRLNRAGFANVTLSDVSKTSSTSLTATVPAGVVSGVWNVFVVNPDKQEGSLANGFTVTSPIPAPVVTGIAPPTGMNSTTTAVTITGTGFNTTVGSDVKLNRAGFANITLSDVSKTSSTSLTATVPAGVVSGVWNVFVVNPDKQEGSLSNGFTVTALIPAPVVTGITPPTGVNSTTTAVTITGSGFNTTTGSEVRLNRAGFSNVSLSDVSKTSATSITGTVPAGVVSGVWNVFVVNPDKQEGSLENGYTVYAPVPAPVVIGISPVTGLNTTATVVTITGREFNVTTPIVNLTRAGFSNIPLTAVVRSSSTSLTGTIPANVIVGAWTVAVTNPDGQTGTNASVVFTSASPGPVPAADFTLTPVTGVGPLTVAFTDTSTNSPTSWNWNFGDGSAGTAQNPSHTYTVIGIYDVSLSATNAIGTGTKTQSRVISVTTPVNQSPAVYHGVTLMNTTNNDFLFNITDVRNSGGTVSNLSTSIVDYQPVGWHRIVVTGTNVSNNSAYIYADQVNHVSMTTLPYTEVLIGVGTAESQFTLEQSTLVKGAAFGRDIVPGANATIQNLFQQTVPGKQLDLGYTLFVTGDDAFNANLSGSHPIYINLSASHTWVLAHGGTGAIRIFHIPDTGIPEVLLTTYIGGDGTTDYFTAQADTLSTFGLGGVTTPPVPTTVPTVTPNGGDGWPSSKSSEQQAMKAPLQQPLSTVSVNVGQIGRTSIISIDVTGVEVRDMIVTATEVSGPGTGISPPPGIVYEYADISPARFTEITDTRINFFVPLSWITEHNLVPDDIVLYHNSGKTWEALPTTLDTVKDGRAYYTALGSGFSRFAITGQLNNSVSAQNTSVKTVHTYGAPVQTTGTSRVTPSRTKTGPVTTTTTAVPAQLESAFPVIPIIIGIVAVVLLIGGGYLVRRWWIRRQNPALFRDYD
nr:IPT/TIG domain-containing protein [uncultured Methanoregula sp.]